MTPGGYISAAGHTALLAWLALGWGLSPEPLDLQVTEVTAVTGAEYAAAVARAAWNEARAEPSAIQEGRGDAPERPTVATARPVSATGTVASVPAEVGPERRAPRAVSHATPPIARAVPAPVVEAERADPGSSRPTERVPAVAAAPRRPVGPARSEEAVTVSSITEALPDADEMDAVTEAPRPPARPADLGQRPEQSDAAEAGPESLPAEEPPPRPAAEAAPRPGPPSEVPQPSAPQAGQGASMDAAVQQAAASYPAQVMQRLSRTRRDRLSVSGTAVIAFTVGDSGGLVALVIAQGSGVEQIDRSGLSLVQRAAPFPPPPPGAQRSYTFQFTGN